MSKYNLIINGEKVAGENADFEVINPADESVYELCPSASDKQLDLAVEGANEAFKSWSALSSKQREEFLNKVADKIEENSEELAKIIVQEQGKPLFLANVEVGAGSAWVRYTSSLELGVKTIEDSDERQVQIHRKPLGVIASITPWNWPFMIAIWHIIPALKTGNTMICKPSSNTPLSTLKLVELMNEVLPKGVINILSGGSSLGAKMSSHEGIRKVVFTGSTQTGKYIMKDAANNLKRLTLELGGNDAGIILPNCENLDEYTAKIFQGAFLNMGQTCAALKRLYVHEDQYDEVCEKLVNLANNEKVGNGLEEGVTFGPVQNQEQLNLVIDLVEDARAKGAKVLCGGHRLDQKGYFYPPTIVSDIDNSLRLVQEEQFGPVLPVIKYSTVEEALAMANDCEVGLGGSVWSHDKQKASEIALKLECGTAWVNNHAEVLPHIPFGGCKLSGIGTEFGEEGLQEFTQIQIMNLAK